MKRWMLFGLLLVGMTAQAQTARKFTLDLTDDGKAQMVCFLPETPSGKAIVGVPGGGYSMLSNTHEGYLASDWLNQQGIAYFVVNYRLPNGDRTLPSRLGHQSSRCGYHGLLGRWSSGIRHLHPFRV